MEPAETVVDSHRARDERRLRSTTMLPFTGVYARATWWPGGRPVR